MSDATHTVRLHRVLRRVFVANLADWDDSILLIPGGQSGQPGSSHYTDQFSYWFDAKPIVQPFTDAAEARTKRHTLTLKPAP